MNMTDIKWIKIVTDIFDDEKMCAIESMTDGWVIELVWFKILCLAGKCNQNGFLIINNKLAYTDEMLSKIFRMDLGIIQRALEIFQSLEMTEVVENSYMVSNWLMYQSGDRLEEVKEKNRIRQQRYRDNQKAKLLEKKDERNVTNNVTNNVTPSYSYSNNSNLSNYLYLLDNCNEEYISYYKDIQEINEIVQEWMKYKDEKKPKSSNHYEETGLKNLLKKIFKMCAEYGPYKVAAAISDSMSNNYQGIVWDYLSKSDKPKKEQSVFDAWMNA
jgi:predicted phage replisome organizer